MKLFVARNNINHRSKTVNRGDIIEEDDRNHIGALQSAGCQKYDPDKHDVLIASLKAPKAPKAPAKKAATKKPKEKKA